MASIRHDYTYGFALVGKAERRGGSYVRRDVYTSYAHGLSETGGDLVHCAGPADVSRQHSNGENYDARCACCWLGHCHSEDEHNANVSKRAAEDAEFEARKGGAR
jgi:hypothetical protein